MQVVLLTSFCLTSQRHLTLINHYTLLEKLSSLGIGGSLLRWVRDFLQNKTMEVVIDFVHSTTRPVLSGVPQGSVLGPLLFIAYINFIAHDLCCSFKMFADDLKLHLRKSRSLDTDDVSSADLQADVDVIFCKSISMGLSLNCSKCHHLRFGSPVNNRNPAKYYSSGQVIGTSQLERDLGIHVDTAHRPQVS